MLLPVQNRVEVEPEVLEAWYLFQLNVRSSNTQFSIQPGQTLVCTETKSIVFGVFAFNVSLLA